MLSGAVHRAQSSFTSSSTVLALQKAQVLSRHSVAAHAATLNVAPQQLPPTVAPPFDPSAQLQACQQGAVEPYAPISGACAWLASDFEDPSDWTVQLSEQHISELEAAVHGIIASGRVWTNGNDLEGVSG